LSTPKVRVEVFTAKDRLMGLYKSMRGKKRKDARPYVKLLIEMIRGSEWQSLSPRAQSIYIYLKSEYNGRNNGAICLPYSEVRKAGIGNNWIRRGFKELQQKGWIEIEPGGLLKNPSLYRLTGKHDDAIQREENERRRR
jgi:hypothetical protein